MTDINSFFKSAFTVDNVIFGFDGTDLKVVLIKRGEAPQAGHWALPGNFVYSDEDLNTAAARVLVELTGLKDVYLEQDQTFGAVGRHPNGRVITVAYYSLIKISNLKAASSFAQTVRWVSVNEAKNLAFDHDEIFRSCFKRLQRQVRSRPVGFELLPPKFTLTELQLLYEAILQTSLDKRNFRKKILSMNLLHDLDEMQEGVAHRPAKLYEFDREKYNQFVAEGMSFELKEGRPKKEKAKKKAIKKEKALTSHF